jgi:hypothetical protein
MRARNLHTVGRPVKSPRVNLVSPIWAVIRPDLARAILLMAPAGEAAAPEAEAQAPVR